jgi:hypothetical protein
MIEFSTDNLDLMYTLLENSWCRETSHTPDKWSESNPACGQCAVTSLVMQDIFGGEIIKNRVTLTDGTITTHYTNKIGNIDLDYTSTQFPEGTKVYRTNQGDIAIREYLESNLDTVKRYKLLKEKVYSLYSEYLNSQGLALRK